MQHGTMLASALHHLARSRANGTHYSSKPTLPLIPGIDAVIRDDHGSMRYVLADASMAEQVLFDPERSVILPNDSDPALVAAAMNPAMASWIALRHRVVMPQGAHILVLGATGSAGRMAIQVAKLFGAERVIGAGRNTDKLRGLSILGADDVITFDKISTAADVDIVLDFLWGDVTEQALPIIIGERSDRSRPLTWIEIGSMAGRSSAILSAALRSCNLTIVGSGIGSVSAKDI